MILKSIPFHGDNLKFVSREALLINPLLDKRLVTILD